MNSTRLAQCRRLCSSISSAGVITFTAAPDFETPGCGTGRLQHLHLHRHRQRRRRRGRWSATLNVKVTVTDVNEPPVFDLTGLTTDADGTPTWDRAVHRGREHDRRGHADGGRPGRGGHHVTYTLGGTDAALFSIGADGAIAFKAAPDFEDPKGGAADDSNTYEFTVTATAGAGARSKLDVLPVKVTVTDVSGGAPAKPAAPTAVATAGSRTSLDVSWTEPANEGPAITDYDVQYRTGATAGTSGWTDPPHRHGDEHHHHRSLTEHQPYEVQVRATNADGDGEWSDPGRGTPGGLTFTSPDAFGEGARHRGGPGAGARPGGAARPRRLPPAGRRPEPRRRRRRALRPRVRRRAVVPAGAGLREPARRGRRRGGRQRLRPGGDRAERQRGERAQRDAGPAGDGDERGPAGGAGERGRDGGEPGVAGGVLGAAGLGRRRCGDALRDALQPAGAGTARARLDGRALLPLPLPADRGQPRRRAVRELPDAACAGHGLHGVGAGGEPRGGGPVDRRAPGGDGGGRAFGAGARGGGAVGDEPQGVVGAAGRGPRADYRLPPGVAPVVGGPGGPVRRGRHRAGRGRTARCRPRRCSRALRRRRPTR